MKTLKRVVIVGVVVCAIYFLTIGTDDFYSLLDWLSEVFQVIGSNYIKK